LLILNAQYNKINYLFLIFDILRTFKKKVIEVCRRKILFLMRTFMITFIIRFRKILIKINHFARSNKKAAICTIVGSGLLDLVGKFEWFQSRREKYVQKNCFYHHEITICYIFVCFFVCLFVCIPRKMVSDINIYISLYCF